MDKKRLVFMGTSDFSLKALEAIYKLENYELVAIYTRAPKPAGRKMELKKSVVQEFAERNNIPCFTPKSLRKDDADKVFAGLKPDLAVVAAYGLIIPQNVLDICTFINIHGSLLPRWRGASPMQAALLHGDKKSGITIMKMDAGIDTGDIISMQSIEITPKMNLAEFSVKMGELGAKMIVDTLNNLQNSLDNAYKQPEEGASYTGKISTEDCRINWNDPAEDILHKIMGVYPEAWTEIDGIRMKVLDADIVPNFSPKKMILSCGDGYLELTKIQPAGKRAMSGEEFIRGHQNINLSAR